MSSNASSNPNTKANAATKIGGTAPTQQLSNHSATATFFATEALGQKRSGTFGSGASTKAASNARNNQTAKSKHKQSKRFRIADEDAFAESVSTCLAWMQ